MTSQLAHLDSVISQSLAHQRKTGVELREMISSFNTLLGVGADGASLELLAKDIESRFSVSMGLGAMVDDANFVPWLDDAKASITPFYWERYKKLLLKNGLPQDVVTGTDAITDRILGRLGNPRLEERWDRRGMVVGHVQSGKTANYTGLICKAADAGYRLIIVIAGIHNNLRNQTQERIDEGFIGRDTGRARQKGDHTIGVGLFDDRKVPVSLTNTRRDFHKDTASSNTSQIDSYKVPVVLVIKKNPSTLKNLLDWLKDNSATGHDQMIDQPMLLIDDEADNASINTKYAKEEVTKINGQIRDLLATFNRSCYVGYTATPFANIFVDPDQYDDALKEDLFPKHFIIGLDAPSNYFGAGKVFIDGLPEDGPPVWLRHIRDNEDLLPIKHRIDQDMSELPPSLDAALRAFLLARTIRNLRGQASKHCSMLVNASRFTSVQGRIRNRIHERLVTIQNAVRINGSLGKAGLADPEISALRDVWLKEYAGCGFEWEKIQAALLEAIASAKVVEVNSRGNGLDYGSSGETGQTVIAVGGFSLSRGLTLEGLTVTWFLRNTMMYDTLMQMGRWFGYRGGYEDLCRIWMPEEAIDWYSHIAEATAELHLELKNMESAKLTPADFGLAVRSHPSALLVTARNKMGSGQKVVNVGLSNAWVETAKLGVKDAPDNMDAAKRFLDELSRSGHLPDDDRKVTGGFLFEEVPAKHVLDFLAAWKNHEAAFLTQTKPIRSYINDRVEDELEHWDVLVASVKGDGKPFEHGAWVIGPQMRKIGLEDLKQDLLSIGDKKARIASRGVEKIGVDAIAAKQAEDKYRKEYPGKVNEQTGKVNYPDSIYRRVRERPLFVLQIVKIREDSYEGPDGQSKELPANFPQSPVVGWGMSLPTSAVPGVRVEYVVNTQKFRELFGEDDEADEDEVSNV
ncbi:endonuclease [Paracoccus sp. SM22M-07]|nr:endonuclease [Paracoccus sp. SM22M-07]